jgi:hypothetical protein
MAKLRASLAAADPEARATLWAQNNTNTILAAMKYPGAAEILNGAGIKL